MECVRVRVKTPYIIRNAIVDVIKILCTEYKAILKIKACNKLEDKMKTILLLIIAAALCTTTVARPIASLELVEKACNVVGYKGRICQHLLSFVALTQSEAPTAREIVAKLLKNKDTKTVLKSAWQKSHFQKDIYQERGGWIFADPNNPNKLQVVLARKSASKPFRLNGNTNPAINLEDVSSAKKGWILIANFHTHPLPDNQEPSFAEYVMPSVEACPEL